MATIIDSLGFAVDTSQLKKAERDLNSLNKTASKTSNVTGKTTKATDSLTKGNNKLSGALRETAASAAILQGPLGPISGRINSIGAAVSRTTPLFVGLGVAIAGAVAVMAKAASAGSQLEQQMFKLEALVKATGGAAGLSAQDINKFAVGLGEATLTSAGAAREAAGVLLTFKSISGDTFKETLRLAQDLSAVGFGDLRSTTLQLAKALEDPVLGLTALRRSGVSFTEAQKDMIKGLVASNDLLGAQSIILETVNQQVGGAAVAAAQGLAGAWDTLIERTTRLLEQLANNSGLMKGLTATINLLSEGVNNLLDPLDETAATFNEISDAAVRYGQAQIAIANATDQLNKIEAAKAETINRITAARDRQIAIATKNISSEEGRIAVTEKFAEKYQKQIDAINQSTSQSITLLKSQIQEEISARNAASKAIDEYADKAKKAYTQKIDVRPLIEQNNILQQFQTEAEKASDDILVLNAYWNAGLISTDAYTQGIDRATSALQTHDAQLMTSLTALQEKYMSQEELLAQNYANEQLLLIEALNNKKIAEDFYKELSIKSQQDFQTKLTDIQTKAEDMRAKATIKSYESIIKFSEAIRARDVKSIIFYGSQSLQASSQNSKKLFQLQKALGLANIAVTLPSAIVKSFEAAGGYPWGIIPAGLMALEGAAQINAIRSASFGSSSVPPAPTGGGAGSIPTLTPATALPQETVLPTEPEERSRPTEIVVSLPSLTSGEAVRELIDRINEEYEDGYRIKAS